MLGLLVGLGVVPWIWFNAKPFGQSAPRDWDRHDAIVNAKQVVRERLKSPATAEFPRLDEWEVTQGADGNTWFVNGWVDSQNGFGAVIRNGFRCRLSASPTSSTFTGTVAFQK